MSTPADKTAALVAALWQRVRPVVEERVQLLDRAAAGPLTPELREEAVSAAHKLSGSLGMYGYPKASEFASQIEHALKHETTPEIDIPLRDLHAALGL